MMMMEHKSTIVLALALFELVIAFSFWWWWADDVYPTMRYEQGLSKVLVDAITVLVFIAWMGILGRVMVPTIAMASEDS